MKTSPFGHAATQRAFSQRSMLEQLGSQRAAAGLVAAIVVAAVVVRSSSARRRCSCRSRQPVTKLETKEPQQRARVSWSCRDLGFPARGG